MNDAEKFIKKVRFNLNLRSFGTEFLTALIIAAALMDMIALAYIASGHKVRIELLPSTFFPALIFLIIQFIRNFYSDKKAAALADKFFAFKDSLSSFLELRKCDDSAFRELQAERTSSACRKAEASAIRTSSPRRKFLLFLLLASILASFCMMDDSYSVKKQKLDTEKIIADSTRINRELQSELEKVKEMLSPAEHELLKKTGIEEQLKKLDTPMNKIDALKQYAAAEKGLEQALESLKNSYDEKLVARIAEMLKKDAASRNLGEKLAEQDYEGGANELMSMRADENSDNYNFAKNMENAERLQNIADKMQQAAQKSPQQGNSEMKQNVASLQKNASSLSQSMKSCSGKPNDQTKENSQKANESLSACKNSLNNMQAMKNFADKMSNFRQSLSCAQNGAQQQQKKQQQPGQNQKGIGSGTGSKQNDEASDDIKTAYDSQINGQKNAGPSETQTQEAASGGTVVRASAKKEKAEFNHEMENFVKRPDIPQETKNGVKNYFTLIHQQDR